MTVGGNEDTGHGLGSSTSFGSRQLFNVTRTVLVTHVSVYGMDGAGGFGLNPGLRVALTKGDRVTGASTFAYDDFVHLAEGTYTGTTHFTGWAEITLTVPVTLPRLAGAARYEVLVDGNFTTTPSRTGWNPLSWAVGTDPVDPAIGSFLSGSSYGGNISGNNSSVRMLFRIRAQDVRVIPPLRARQRLLVAGSHATQATTNPVTLRARGDY